MAMVIARCRAALRTIGCVARECPRSNGRGGIALATEALSGCAGLGWPTVKNLQRRRTIWTSRLRRLELPGLVLAAALGCDLVLVAAAASKLVGPVGMDLLLLPGVVALAACALWAQWRPAAATFSGAGVLLGSTVLIAVIPVEPYTTMLVNVSFAEAVGCAELVYYCVREFPWRRAALSVASLVVAAAAAVTGRVGADDYPSSLTESWPLGAVLGGALIAGVVARHNRAATGPSSRIVSTVHHHWLLLGGLTAALFVETFHAPNDALAIPVLVLCAAALAFAVYATRQPVLASAMLAVVVLLAAVFTVVTGVEFDRIGGVPFSQVVAGLVAVVWLVRRAPAMRAVMAIMALTCAVVSAAVLAEIRPAGAQPDRAIAVVGATFALGVTVALGLYLRYRDAARAQQVRAEVMRAQHAERMALARELHDVVAHHVTGIVVQAQAAQQVAPKDPQTAVAALEQIGSSGSEALAAMRRLVRSMRGDLPVGSTEFSEQATVDLGADLRRLVGNSDHGVATQVDLDVSVDVPQDVARSGLRLVQEALTNVGKHARDATMVTVTVRTEPARLVVRVHDDATVDPDPPVGGSDGYGLVGMRERVAVLRGEFEAGPAPNGGWVVEAWLPLAGDQAVETSAGAG